MSHPLPLPQHTRIVPRGATPVLRRIVDSRLAICRMQWDRPRRNTIKSRSASIAIDGDSVTLKVTAEHPADKPGHGNASPRPCAPLTNEQIRGSIPRRVDSAAARNRTPEKRNFKAGPTRASNSQHCLRMRHIHSVDATNARSAKAPKTSRCAVKIKPI